MIYIAAPSIMTATEYASERDLPMDSWSYLYEIKDLRLPVRKVILVDTTPKSYSLVTLMNACYNIGITLDIGL